MSHKHLWKAKSAFDGRLAIDWFECGCGERMLPNEITRHV